MFKVPNTGGRVEFECTPKHIDREGVHMCGFVYLYVCATVYTCATCLLIRAVMCSNAFCMCMFASLLLCLGASVHVRGQECSYQCAYVCGLCVTKYIYLYIYIQRGPERERE